MKRIAMNFGRLAVVGSLVWLLVGGVGCSSEKSDDQQAASQKETTYGRTVEKAEEVVAALANPKPGFDPVCYMAINEDAVIVTIDGKDYGVCSAGCAEELKANPDKYLLAAADDHEGHDHDH